MSNDNVISLGSRKPYAQEVAEQEAAIVQAAEDNARRGSEHQEICLQTLDKLKDLVAKGRLTGLIIIGREPTSGLFLTETVLDAAVTPVNEMFAYVGVMETLKLELTDYASMAPALMTDGSVLDAHAGSDEDDEEEEFP